MHKHFSEPLISGVFGEFWTSLSLRNFQILESEWNNLAKTCTFFTVSCFCISALWITLIVECLLDTIQWFVNSYIFWSTHCDQLQEILSPPSAIGGCALITFILNMVRSMVWIWNWMKSLLNWSNQMINKVIVQYC